jgi:D-arginine dehydrogenase
MTWDFIVIGGGIAGTSAGARCRTWAPSSCWRPKRRSPITHRAARRRSTRRITGTPSPIALNKASRADHDTLDGGFLSPRGLLLLGRAGRGGDGGGGYRHDGADPISPEEARARVPILDPEHVTRAGFHEAAWDIDTDRMVQHFARTIRSNGGEVHAGNRVTAIARDGARWSVTTIGRDPALGARHPERRRRMGRRHRAEWPGWTPLGLRPLRRSIARMPAPGGHDVSGWPMLLGAGERWYAKADAGAWLVSPAEEDPVTEPHDAYADDMVLAEGIARYQPFVTEEVVRVTSSWAGLRTFAPDRCLVLGPDPGRPDFVWVAGQGGYGFQTAPAASRLVADLIAGRDPALPADIVAALRPDRLRSGARAGS